MRYLTCSNFEQWRSEARQLLVLQVPPTDASFCDETGQLRFASSVNAAAARSPAGPQPALFRVPPQFLAMAEHVACHRSADRFNLLYRLLWRLTHGEQHLLEIASDDDVHRALQMQQGVSRDVHKMHAFVRFRKIADGAEEHYIAWHRPDHRIVRLAAPFFARRFPAMRWSILTPSESAHWNGEQLTYGDGVPASAAPQADQLDELWRTYYRSIFNPARLNVKTMKREMPVRHWRTLPETAELPGLIKQARQRTNEMLQGPLRQPATPAATISEGRDLGSLRAAACKCEACDLCGPATQMVFGDGPSHPRVMLVGEQPGDEDDRQGRPFVGPAGQVLRAALVDAGLQSEEVYLTNAVKHFRFQIRGKRRLHQKPTHYHIAACRPWLEAEAALLRPQVLICLGATAVQAVLRKRDRLSELRGRIFRSDHCERTIATYHPSAVLRAGDPTKSAEIRQALVDDLRAALALLI